ncbi:MAG TPA: amino acid permease, partial [Saprospiraceae bacterium]|nr:amino acid permease [Saprospiraceae bacterium]
MHPTTHRKIGWVSAGSIVVANMVGTGAFTTLGLQLQHIHSTWAILSLWVFGGVIALLGAVSYAELGARMPRSGGEYYYLSQIYHPLAGYLSGWISLTVGFTASIALSAMAMGAYLSEVVGTDA